MNDVRISFVLTEKDYSVLENALETYPKDKKITKSLLQIMEYNYGRKTDKKQNKS